MGLQTSQNNLENNTTGEFTFPNFKMYNEVTLVRVMGFIIMIHIESNITDNPEISSNKNTHI